MALSSVTQDDKTVQESLRLFNEGCSQLNSEITAKSHKNKAVIVLGMTGAGKSTVTEILCGNLTQLNSVKLQHGNGFVICDKQGRIGDAQVSSKTFLPEFHVCEQDPTLIFLDNPGFGENRGVAMDIAAMALIKKIADQVEQVKFVIVVSASSVTYSNIQRNEFSQLCTHVTSFIKNLSKIEDSVCLVINKVNNLDPCSGMRIEEHSVKTEVTSFLKEVSDQPSTSPENKRLISCLLKGDSKWALIRYPNKEGPLSEMDSFVEIQKKLIETCKDKLAYGCMTKEDFGVTITPDSKYLVQKKLIPFIKEQVDKTVESLMSVLVTIFVENVKREHLAKCEQSEETISCIDILHKVALLRVNITQFEKDNSFFSLKSPEKIKLFEKLFSVSLMKEQVDNVESLEEQLNLFGELTAEQHSSEKGASFRLIRAVNNVKLQVEKLHNETLEIAKENVHTLECTIKGLAQVIIRTAMKNYEDNISTQLEKDDLGVIEKLDSDWDSLELLDRDGTGATMNKLSEIIICITQVLQTELNEDLKTKLFGKENELEMLLEIIYQKSTYFISGAPNLLAEVRKDFRTIRSKSWEHIRENGCVHVQNEIGERIEAIVGFLEGFYLEEQLYAGLNINTLSKKRQLLASILEQLKRGSGRVNKFWEFFSQLFEMVGHEQQISDGKKLEELERLLDFYDEKLGNPLPRPTDNWMECVRGLEDRLTKLNTLLEFLEKCKNSDVNGVAAFDADVAKGKGVVIENFLTAFQASEEIRCIMAKNAGPNEKIFILEIAKYMAGGRTKLVKTHEPGKVIVKGKHVRLSDVDLLLNRELKGLPRELLVEAEEWEVDKSFDAKGSGMVVKVLAPKWINKGAQLTIQLSGNDGQEHREKKGGNGTTFGGKGADGLEGNWGGDGGSLFGIYKEIVNGEGLRIFANGGNGGDGQDGGDGFIGRDPKEPRESSSLGLRASPISVVDKDLAIAMFAASYVMTLAEAWINRSIRCSAEGCRGGNGGNGGDSGYPGGKGLVQIIRVEDGVVNAFGTIVCRDGNPGCGGQGGKGAEGGSGCAKGSDGVNGSVRKVPSTQEAGLVMMSESIDACDLKEYKRFITEDIPYSEKGQEFLRLIQQASGFSF